LLLHRRRFPVLSPVPATGPDLGKRWPSRLVATAAEDGLIDRPDRLLADALLVIDDERARHPF
jgi:hypothetical protein